MAEIDLSELRGLLEAATPGPWEAWSGASGGGGEYISAPTTRGNYTFGISPGIGGEVGWSMARNDTAAIAAAVNALPALLDEIEAGRKVVDDERAAKKIAADAADRFRDVLSECLGHADENPGDDVLVAKVREHFGKSGPEPTRWRDFLTGAIAQLDQIYADREVTP